MNEKKKVLIFTYSFPPYNAGPVIRVTKFVKYLPRFGWDPVVLTVDSKYHPAYIYKDTSLLLEIDKNIKIFRTPVLKNKYMLNFEKCNLRSRKIKNSVFTNIFKIIIKNVILPFLIPDRWVLWLPYALRRGMHILKIQKIDVIFAVTPPHSTGLAGLLLSKLSKVPLVLDVKDDWIGNPFFANKRSISLKINKWIERSIVSHSQKVITVTDESRNLFLNKYPNFNQDKYIVIPNGFDPDDYLNREDPFFSHTQNDKIKIVYSGNLNIKRDPVFFLQALKELEWRDRFEVFFIGLIHDKHKQIVKDLGLSKIVTCIDYLPHQVIINYLLHCDVCLLIIPEQEGSKTAIPGKIYEYIRAGKPILALTDERASSARLIKKEGLGWVCNFTEKKKIKIVLTEILKKYQKGELNLKARQTMIEKYSRERLTEKLSNVFFEIVKG